ncbi:stage VI sporulation protein D [Bacillus sp. FJAT-29790]|uniref:stage VI sporulation protein D n=1 Tax=Bacillus sp. FJAT-29790 TaxID=1895002 RepID=UPI001C21F251|nr:stage VI sporulation protein D [Bacillus sp. FJAT-29790]MBU8879582.1 stage VI sporulation protein D [Bacillus sp. FJAT-29790]
MSQESPSCLRFSLEESVWFQKGQEVSELISISLDPDIMIQENDQYVTIQGSLELTGEYKRTEIGTSDDERTFTAPKFIQVIEEREEGTCEFTHYFPVDITIPNNRIQSIHDIDVAVESFDYVFPEKSCMRLTAHLTISGLYGEQQHIPSFEVYDDRELEQATQAVDFEYEQDEQLYDDEESGEFENNTESASFEAPVRESRTESPSIEPVFAEARTESPSIESVFAETRTESPFFESIVEEAKIESPTLEAQDDVEDREEIYVPFEAVARKRPEAEVENQEKQPDKFDVHFEPEISFSAQRNEKKQPSAKEIYKMAEMSESEESPVQEVKVEVEVKVEEKVYHEEESSEHEEKHKKIKKEESSDKEMKQKKQAKKKSMSLTEFFARKAEDEVAKLKVCIVQNGDTVDIIAERYDIAVQQLLRVNQLEINQDIYEGQVLYIPVAVAR